MHMGGTKFNDMLTKWIKIKTTERMYFHFIFATPWTLLPKKLTKTLPGFSTRADLLKNLFVLFVSMI